MIPPDRGRPARAETSPATAARRPAGVTALAIFFAVGALVALVAAISLARPGGMLEPMWRLNPKGREGLRALGPWGAALLGGASLACALSAAGLGRGARWGRRLAMVVLAIQLAGDAANVALGVDRRAAFGIPVALALLLYLSSRRVGAYFDRPRHR